MVPLYEVEKHGEHCWTVVRISRTQGKQTVAKYSNAEAARGLAGKLQFLAPVEWGAY